MRSNSSPYSCRRAARCRAIVSASRPIFIALLSPTSRGVGRCAKSFLEERQRAAPGEIGRRLVVARRAGVVVEGMLRARIGVDGVLLVVRLERRLVGRDAGVHRLVVLGIV